MHDWISVRNRLPDEPQDVLLCDANRRASCKGHWYGGSHPWDWQDRRLENITHWLPIPDLPKAEPRWPRCPWCDCVLSSAFVAVQHSKYTNWACPDCEQKIRGEIVLCKKEEMPQESGERGKCKDCNYWGWYDKGVVRNCYHHLKLTEDTDSCGDFQARILPGRDQ